MALTYEQVRQLAAKPMRPSFKGYLTEADVLALCVATGATVDRAVPLPQQAADGVAEWLVRFMAAANAANLLADTEDMARA